MGRLSLDFDAVVLDCQKEFFERAQNRMKPDDICFAFDGPEACMVRLVKLSKDHYRSWWVEDIRNGTHWDEPVSEGEMSDPLNEMEVLAWSAL